MICLYCYDEFQYWPNHPGLSMNPMPQKLMITGEKRSGTTLIANFLNAQRGFTVYRDFLHI